jgi:predicted peptidase
MTLAARLSARAAAYAALPALFAVLAGLANPETGFLDRGIVIGGETYRYQVYVPAEYSASEAWPVIVSLHGGGRQGTDGIQPTATDFATHIRNNRASVPAIVIFPQARPNTRFMYPEMEDLVMAEFRRTVAEFHVDTNRVYLQGNSMGGEGAYRIAYRWPRTFAALVVSSGPVRVDAQAGFPQDIVDLDHRTNAFAAAKDPYAALAAGIKHLPIWVVHGDSDEVIPVEESRRLVDALKREGAAVHYTEYPGSSHDGTAAKAYTDEALYTWLFAQHR